MRIDLIRMEFITHLDGVNRFIANLAEAFKLLGHEVFILSWCYKDVREGLSSWFKIVHGLDVEVEVAYPLVKVIPSLRMLVAVVAEKTGYIEFPQRTTRW